MIKILQLEYYKFIKRFPLFLAILSLSSLVSLLHSFYIRHNFNSKFLDWIRLSHGDKNPYNFLVTNMINVLGFNLIYGLIFTSFLLLSVEYKNKTTKRLMLIPKDVYRIPIAKSIVIFIIGLFLFFINIVLIYNILKKMPALYPKSFVHYTLLTDVYWPIPIGIFIIGIAKLILFHTIVTSVCRRYYFLPIVIGCILPFALFANIYQPYQMLYIAAKNHVLDLEFIKKNTISLVVVFVLYIAFFNAKTQNILLKRFPI